MCIGIAAIAAGKLPVPSRTRQISPSASLTVLSCASTRELRVAAMPCSSFHPIQSAILTFSTKGLQAISDPGRGKVRSTAECPSPPHIQTITEQWA